MADAARRTEATGRPIRVAVVAPPWYEIPPSGYGGIERICFDLVEGLVDRGHAVTLVAAGARRTRAAFAPALPEPLSGLGTVEHPVQEVLYGAAVARALEDVDVDVVHDHSLAGPLVARPPRPTVLTAHGPVDGWLGGYFRLLGLPLVAISEAQRGTAPDLPWAGVVHNSIDVAAYPFRADKDDVVLFLGRMAPEKGAHLAAGAARAAGFPVVLAGKAAEAHERRYFDEQVAPTLGPDATWVGEVAGTRRTDLLGRARCLVCPVQWDEPFGLASIEAMACGTPVVALRRGAMAEVVEHGRTGWLCDDPAELAEGVRRAGELDPRECRAAVAERFDTATMVDRYVEVYRRLLDDGTRSDAS